MAVNKTKPVIPENVAIIPDGNRRWSKSNRLSLHKGYNLGIKKFVDISIWLKHLGVSTVTVWALSTDNIINRSKGELAILYNLYTKAAYDSNILTMLEKEDAKVVVVGELGMVPQNVRKALKHIEKETSRNNSFTITLLIAYGGKADILTAVKRAIKAKAQSKIKEINEKILTSMMLTASVPNPDMIIRTSGEQRTSGFLPWQSSYSELYFSKKYWPDFGISDLKAAIREYSSRQRRYGK